MSSRNIEPSFAQTMVLLILSSNSLFSEAIKCEKDGLSLDCTNRGLTDIPWIPPDVTTVLLDNNAISRINDKAFVNSTQITYLSLRNNSIKRLHHNSFQGLVNLTIVYLGHNKLCLGNDSYPPGVFKPAPNLQILSIVSNECDSPNKQYYPESAFSDLKSLNTFALSGISSKLGYGFASMVNLRTLMFMGTKSNMSELPEETFDALENVTVTRLSMRNSDLSGKHLPSLLLKPFNHLKYLNLACNSNISINDVVRLINNMNGPTIRTLSVDAIGEGTGEIVDLLKLNVLRIRNLHNLKRLSLHQMATIDINTIGVELLASVETLVLGHVRLYLRGEAGYERKIAEIFLNSSLKYVALPYFDDPKYNREVFKKEYCVSDEIDTEDGLFFRHIEIQGYDIGQISNNIKSNRTSLSNRPSRSPPTFESLFFEFLPPNIHVLALDHSQMPVIVRILSNKINPMNNVKILNLTQMVAKTQTFNFKQLSKFPQLVKLEARYCRIQNIDSDFLSLKYLTDLDLDNNNIESLGASFGGVPNLTILSLRNNRISFLSPDVFKGLTKLTEVYLSRNFISSSFFDVGVNPLRLLELPSNRIPHLDKQFLDQLEKLSSSLTLDVTNNSFSCSCSILPLSDWLRDTTVNVVNGHKLTCYSDSLKDTVKLLDAFSRSKRVTCLSWAIPVISVVCIIVVFVVMVLLFYKFRWSVQLVYYIFLRRLRLQLERRKCVFCLTFCCPFYKRKGKNRLSQFTYDAFLAHGGDDYNFIIDGFSDRIEGWGVKLYISERDSEGGKPIVHNLVEAIDSSRLVICLLTPGFAESDWCDFELKMALDRGKETVVFIYKEHIPWKIASKTLSRIIFERNFIEYIEYTEDPDGNSLFWRKLKEVLTKGMNSRDESSAQSVEISETDWNSGPVSSVHKDARFSGLDKTNV